MTSTGPNEHPDPIHVPSIRSHSHLSKPTLPPVLARISADPVPDRRRSAQEPVNLWHSLSAVLHDRHGGVGNDGLGDLERGSNRGRTSGRLDATASHHSPAHVVLLRGQDILRLSDGARQ